MENSENSTSIFDSINIYKWYTKWYDKHLRIENVESYAKYGVAWFSYLTLITTVFLTILILSLTVYLKGKYWYFTIPFIFFGVSLVLLFVLRKDNKLIDQLTVKHIQLPENKIFTKIIQSLLTKDLLVSFNNTSKIIYDVDEILYSAIAEKCLSTFDDDVESYTILSISPKNVYEEIFYHLLEANEQLMPEEIAELEKIRNIKEKHIKETRFLKFVINFHYQRDDLDSFYNEGLKSFKHFNVFEKEPNMIRIILETYDNWLDDNKAYLYFFLRYINKKMRCYILEEKTIGVYTFKDDYVIFNDKLSLVYFPNSLTLNIQFLQESDSDILKILKGIPDIVIRQKKARYEYLQLNDDYNTNPILIELKEDVDKLRKAFQIESKSLLYHGYEHAGKINSIKQQRSIQKDIIRTHIQKLDSERIDFLSIGCAFGGELKHFINSNAFLEVEKCNIIAVDNSKHIDSKSQKEIESLPKEYFKKESKILREKEEELNKKTKAIKVEDLHSHQELLDELDKQKSILNKNEIKLEFKDCDLLDPKILQLGEFDIVQCGFILEDIAFGEKEEALEQVLSLTKSGGLIIISEMFLDNLSKDGENEQEIKDERERKANVIRLYSSFLSEASSQIKEDDDLFDLCKDTENLGLIRCMVDSIAGTRDHFLSFKDFIDIMDNASTKSNNGCKFRQDLSKINKHGFIRHDGDKPQATIHDLAFLQVLVFEKV